MRNSVYFARLCANNSAPVLFVFTMTNRAGMRLRQYVLLLWHVCGSRNARSGCGLSTGLTSGWL
jgi:hypothetical protein